MGARIPVNVSKPHERYELTGGDIKDISKSLIAQLGKEDAARLAKYLCCELEIQKFET